MFEPETAWWKLPVGADVSDQLLRDCEALAEQQAYRETDADDSLALYFGNTRNSVRGWSSGSSMIFDVEPPGYNVIQSCVDTKTAHIAKNKIKPYFLTSKGSWEDREKAQGMARAVEAIFDAEGIYGELGIDVCFQGQLFEAGVVKVIPDVANNRVRLERVFAHDLFVSDRDATHRRPRMLAHRSIVDRAQLLDFFKDSGEEILKAIREAQPAPFEMSQPTLAHQDQIVDQVVVWEVWHLPSGDPEMLEDGQESDGRRAIIIQGSTLLNEEWRNDYFPFAFFRPMPKPVGFWSRSIPETLAGAQIALNRMNKRVDGIMNLHARPLLVVARRAKVNTAKITNDWATILECDGEPNSAVVAVTYGSIPAEYVQRIERIIQWAERQAGLSEMSIAAEKPAGVNHAPGMQHLTDVESLRHTPAFRDWEQFHIQLAKLVVWALRVLASEVKNFEVIWGGDKELERIKWKDVDLDDSKWRLRIWPTNLLPQTPAAKTSRVIEFVQAGIFSPAQALMALEYPDIEALMGDANAAQENIEEKIRKLVSGGNYEENMPHPYMNLDLAKRITGDKINRYEADGMDQDKLELLRQFYKDVLTELSKQAPPAAPMPPAPPAGPEMMPPGAPPGPPMGAPMPPPVA